MKRRAIKEEIDTIISAFPVKRDDVVDPSAALTDPANKDRTPKSRVELEVALRQIVKMLPVEKIPFFYRDVCDMIKKQNDREKKELEKLANSSTVKESKDTFMSAVTSLNFSESVKEVVDSLLNETGTTLNDASRVVALNAINDYIMRLSAAGEIAASEVELVKSHPDVIYDFPNFKKYLSDVLSRARGVA